MFYTNLFHMSYIQIVVETVQLKSSYRVFQLGTGHYIIKGRQGGGGGGFEGVAFKMLSPLGSTSLRSSRGSSRLPGSYNIDNSQATPFKKIKNAMTHMRVISLRE